MDIDKMIRLVVERDENPLDVFERELDEMTSAASVAQIEKPVTRTSQDSEEDILLRVLKKARGKS